MFAGVADGRMMMMSVHAVKSVEFANICVRVRDFDKETTQGSAPVCRLRARVCASVCVFTCGILYNCCTIEPAQSGTARHTHTHTHWWHRN